MNPDDLIRTWHYRICRIQFAHYDAATHFERLNLILGIPVILLTTAVGTTIFSTLTESHSTRTQLYVGLLSVLAAVLASLQTFLRFAERAEKHRACGARYAGLKTELEVVQALPREPSEMREFLESFCARWAALHGESPTIPDRIYARATSKVESIKGELDVGTAGLISEKNAAVNQQSEQ